MLTLLESNKGQDIFVHDICLASFSPKYWFKIDHESKIEFITKPFMVLFLIHSLSFCACVMAYLYALSEGPLLRIQVRPRPTHSRPQIHSALTTSYTKSCAKGKSCGVHMFTFVRAQVTKAYVTQVSMQAWLVCMALKLNRNLDTNIPTKPTKNTIKSEKAYPVCFAVFSRFLSASKRCFERLNSQQLVHVHHCIMLMER